MDLEGLRALVIIVEEGSFVGAARRLGMTRATLRRRVEALEASVGRPLLLRSHEGATPTPAGEVLVAQGRTLLEGARVLLSAAREVHASPAGRLRVMLPPGMPPHLLLPLATVLRLKYPALAFDLRIVDDPASSLLEEADIILHFGHASPEGPWASMEVTRLRRWLLASSDYLQEHGTPTSAAELGRHALLSWAEPGTDGTRWPLRAGGTVEVSPLLVSRDIHLLRQGAQMGMGIACLPDALLPEPGPALVPVLAEEVGDELSLRMLVPTTLEQTPRLRAILSELRQLRASIGLPP